MPLLAATYIRVAFGIDVILDGVSLSIEPGERIGVVGRNGQGKSTLFRVMAGLLAPDGGEVVLQRNARVGFLTQDPRFEASETLRDAAEGAFAELHEMHRLQHEMYDQMAHATGEALDKIMKQQVTLEHRIEAAGGYAIDHRIDATLHGLGFTDTQFGVKCGDLSGGQRARLALARLLLEAPDVLLLDEPTNHLDIDGRLWLERFLSEEFQGAVVMVSHDRYLLDNVVTRIVEIEMGRLIDYPGSYSAFREMRLFRRLTQQRAYEKQQTKFKSEEAFIRRYKAGQRAKQARGRQSILDRAKQEALERPIELDTLRLSLPKAARTGDQVIMARGLSKAYAAARVGEGEGDPSPGPPSADHPLPQGERVGSGGGSGSGGHALTPPLRGGPLPGGEVGKVLFRELDVTIGRGERWGIIGPNGAGKTTLVRCLLGEQKTDAGFARLGSNVQAGYFSQREDGIDPDLPLTMYLKKEVKRNTDGAVDLTEQQSRDLAGAFLFSGSDQDKEMRVLSGGERSRCRLAALVASARNLLVLDEPTNHLDIPSAERLEDALSMDGGYEGAVILISHDRAIIDSVCDHLIVLDGEGGAQVFLGNWSDWQEKQKEREGRRSRADQEKRDEDERRRRQAEARQREEEERKKKPVQSAPPEDREARKQSQKLARMTVVEIEARIEAIEKRTAEIDAALMGPDVWRDAKKPDALGTERAKLRAEVEPLEFEWSRRAEGVDGRQ